jgi:hypothetical protein
MREAELRSSFTVLLAEQDPDDSSLMEQPLR